MDRKTEYEDGKGLPTDVQIQHDSYQDTCWPSVETDKPILKFTRHYKEPQGAQATLNKKNKVGGATLPCLKTYCKATVMKTVWSWHKNGNTGPRKSQNPAINPHFMINSFPMREPRPVHAERRVLCTRGAGTPRCAHGQKMKLCPTSLFTKANSKQMQDVHVRGETIQPARKK